jgi:ribonuclease P protein subunit RPR2
MPKKFKTLKQGTKKIALERIKTLFKEAEKQFNELPEYSDRYVKLARQLSMKYKVPIPRELKKRFCRRCYSYLKPGKNQRIRSQKDKMVYTCLECGHIKRYIHD